MPPNHAKSPRLIILAAPSGGGKTTLCEMLLKEFKDIALSVSTTTRDKRPHEQEGVHYHFVTDAEFQKKVAANEFAEWAFVHQHRYGTSRRTIEDCFARGKHVLFDIDVQGARSLRQLYPKQALLIFIHAPSLDVLEQRLTNRKGDTPEAIAKRLANAQKEIEESSWFDYQLVNEDLEKTYAELRKVVKRECGL